MRIALALPTYWPEVMRGSERFVNGLGSALAGRGHEVTLLTSHRGPTARSVEDGIRVVRRRRPPRTALLATHEYHLENVPNVIAGLLAGSFDVVHAHFPADAWAAVRARRLGGPPVVVTLHGIPTRPYLVARRHRLAMLTAVARDAERVAVGSAAAAAPFRSYLLREPDVISPGLDSAGFAVEAERAAAPTLLCAASLGDPRKRAPLLFRAFELLRSRMPDARLVVIRGRDPVMSREPVELPPGASWLEPSAETPVLARRYASAWATVLPAVEEAFGIVLTESLAAGTPVVADRSGAGPEIVDSDEVGRLFDRDDPGDLARAMAEALSLAKRPETAAACRRRAADFAWPRVADAYEALYRAAAPGTRASQK